MHLFLITSFFLFTINIEAQTYISYDTSKAKIENVIVPTSIYSVGISPFDQSDISRRISYLGNEVQLNDVKIDEAVAKYSNKSQRSTFVYDKNQNRCVFSNRNVGPLKGSFSDAEKFKSVADQYLVGILGDKGKSYRFINNTFDEYTMRDFSGRKYIAFITYRYVPVLDGVPVLGTIAQAKVTIGENGKLAAFQSCEPSIHKSGTIKAKVANSAIGKVLFRKVNSPEYFPPTQDGVVLKADTAFIKKWTASYFEISKAGQRLLFPHMSLFVLNKLAKNNYGLDTERSLINLSMNASDWAGLSTEDIEMISAKQK